MAPDRPKPWVTGAGHAAGARLRLLCLPWAGGGSSSYRNWQASVPPSIEVCPVQLPGRENRLREPRFTSYGDLVQAMALALQPYLDMPFAFFGHSMGAMLAFETTRVLRTSFGLRPLHLFVSGYRAPHLPAPFPPIFELPDDQFVDEVRRLAGTPQEVLDNPELMDVVLPLLRADMTIVDTYRYEPGEPLDCPITALGALKDGFASREALADWKLHTTDAFAVRMFPGDHFYLTSKSWLLLRTISAELEADSATLRGA